MEKLILRKLKKKCHSLQKDRLQHGYSAQTACMVVNPIMVDKFASMFNRTTCGQSSD